MMGHLPVNSTLDLMNCVCQEQLYNLPFLMLSLQQ